MDSPMFSKYSWLDFLFSVVGVCTFLFDVGSDIWVATEFYSRGDFFWFGVLIGLMVLSSVVVQMFSWFWFKYDRELEGFDEQTAKNVLFGGCVKLSFLLHVLQLGFFCRHISAIWQGFRVWWRQEQGSGYAVYLTHDLSMLRLIETFCESAPQLTLMTHIMLHTNKARTVQCVSVVASTTSIAWMVVDYHRSLRSFLPDKAKQGWGSALVYFLWNLLLIAPRVAAVALFATIQPSYLAAHFLLIWPVLVFWVWRQETDFMDSAGGEWLYRATVGLIWYFSWFNVAEGGTRRRSIIYHSFMATDGGILLVTWWFYRDPVLTQSYAPILLATLPLTYLMGVLFKTLYYYCFHPTLWMPSVREAGLEEELPDGQEMVFRSIALQTGTPRFRNKRMASHATHFYSEEEARKPSKINRREANAVV
ncbi:XK-related protein 8.3 isoform X1 [Oncorhynchus kisutch]|uniref:XK-related protein n=2 Tax=Oncorhynchus kisutch TaxID=8019 RepID=A0A8C7F6D3_ONCKI|nr:XK-related protein 8 isoform X1 [Oncorhynchus kisutch]